MRLRIVIPLFLLSLVAALSPPESCWSAPAEGHLQIVLAQSDDARRGNLPGAVIELLGPDGRRFRAALSRSEEGAPARALFWGLPAGDYKWRFTSDAEDEWSERRLTVSPGVMDRIVVHEDAKPCRVALHPTVAFSGLDRAFRDLPGSGTDALTRLSTFPDLWSATSWEGLKLENPARREPMDLPFPLSVGVASQGFPSLMPPAEEQGWQLSREGAVDPRPAIRGLGRLDDSDRLDATGRLRWKPRMALLRDLEVVLQVRDNEDPYPRSTADGPRPHSNLDAVNLLGTLRWSGAGSSWSGWASAAGKGHEQDFLPKGYAKDREHAPHEEWAFVTGSVGVEKEVPVSSIGSSPSRGPWRQRFRAQAHGSRVFRETGDGVHFDVLPSYGRPDGNNDKVDGGTLWRGDNAVTATDEGHVYDHYLLTVATSWGGSVSWEVIPWPTTHLRAELSGTIHDLRHYEHFAPTLTFREEGGGYLDVRKIGYTEDGLDRDPDTDLEVPELQASLSWDAFGSRGAWRASLYGLLYQASHAGPDDWNSIVPVSDTLEVFESQLKDPGWKGGFGGSVGHSFELGQTVVWGEGRLKVRRPPLLSLALDPGFLYRSSLEHIQPLSPFGNPDLGPEKETWLQVGTRFHFPRRSIPFLKDALWLLGGGDHLYVQAALYGAWTTDAWVQKVTSEEQGSLSWIDDSGRRRLRGLHVDLMSAPEPPERGMWFAVSYDRSRLESRGGGPLFLDALWREPDLPASSPGARETTDSFGTPLSAWEGVGYAPHSLDRAHRLSVAFIYRILEKPGFWNSLWSGWALGGLFRFDSGRPYTPIALYTATLSPVAEGLVGTAQEVVPGEPHSGRLPDTHRLDLSATRRWRLLDRELTLKLEVLNVLGRDNVLRVYRATGEPDDDGYLETTEGRSQAEVLGDDFVQSYREALNDPFNYDIPRIFRISAEITLSRLPIVISPRR